MYISHLTGLETIEVPPFIGHSPRGWASIITMAPQFLDSHFTGILAVSLVTLGYMFTYCLSVYMFVVAVWPWIFFWRDFFHMEMWFLSWRMTHNHRLGALEYVIYDSRIQQNFHGKKKVDGSNIDALKMLWLEHSMNYMTIDEGTIK